MNSSSIQATWQIDESIIASVVSFRIQCRQFINNSSQFSQLTCDKYLKMSSLLPFTRSKDVSIIISALQPQTAYQIYLISITRQHSSSVSISNVVDTWPVQLTAPRFLHLRLSCKLHCVHLSWQPPSQNQQWIIGYRVQFQLTEAPKLLQHNIIERNVTLNEFTSSPSDHYLGFNYEFRVAAYSRFQMGLEAVDSIEIIEGSPSTAPYAFKIQHSLMSSPTSVVFTWNALPQQALNGRLSHYQILCYVVGSGTQQSSLTHRYLNTTQLDATINNLQEDTNYACQIRAWIRKSAGPWSNIINFKTKEAYLPPPQEVRLVRLSHSRAEISWLWQMDFPKYYSYFLIHLTDESVLDKFNKRPNSNNHWLTFSTDSIVTKFYLSNLNATTSYVAALSSVSKRNIVGPKSRAVLETKLSVDSWPAKSITKLVCAPENSRSIQLRWSIDFPSESLIHFRVNFTGQLIKTNVDQSSSAKHTIIRDRSQEQSLLMIVSTVYFTHKLINLLPNTHYQIDVEPIFASDSVMIGRKHSVSCTTHKKLPMSVPQPQLVAINRQTNQLKLLLKRPNIQNGTIDYYYLLISTSLFSKSRHKRHYKALVIRSINRYKRQITKTQMGPDYLYYLGQHQQLFPENSHASKSQLITIGGNKNNPDSNDDTHSISNDILPKNYRSLFKQFQQLDFQRLYSFKLIGCIKVLDSTKEKSLTCKESSWSKSYNLNESLASSSFNIGDYPQSDKTGWKNKIDDLSLGSLGKPTDNNSDTEPSSITTTTIVVILSLIILTVLIILVVIYVRYRRNMSMKLGTIYTINNNNPRLSKDKSMCLDQMLKEPLVSNSQVISNSGSLRFTNQHYHSNPYLETTRIQLSSTPDLLVRSSVHQSMGPLLQFSEKSKFTKYTERGPIPGVNLADLIFHLKENDGKLFSLEYESIDPGQQFTWSASNIEVNRLKNRYANVVAYDHSRVILQPIQGVSGSDYINANYIDGYMTSNAYIATQGPLSDNIGDFWRMVWEQDSRIIVMMTRLEERDRAKCDQYWPLGGKGSLASYSYVNVTVTEVVELAYYTIRRFTITSNNSNEIREIRHLQFTAWPDHGVPSHPAPLLMFLRRVRSETPASVGPMIVHCSAGVGRTGAFIVIDWMLERLRHESTIDVYNCVTQMRSQRNYMVQTEEQYIFVHEVLLEAVQCGNTEVSVGQLSQHVDQLESVPLITPTRGSRDTTTIHPTGLQLEFDKVMSTVARIHHLTNYHTQTPHLYANNTPSATTATAAIVVPPAPPQYFHSAATPSTSSPGHSSSSTSYHNLLSNHAPLTYDTANLPVNQMKNRIIQILPPDFSRVSLYPLRGQEGSDYINASWIDGYRHRHAYIAAQAPLADTLSDFWRMIWQHQSTIIVMLTKLRESNRDKCHCYWPIQHSLILNDGIRVEAVAEYDMTSYVMREFRISREAGSYSNNGATSNGLSSSASTISIQSSNNPVPSNSPGTSASTAPRVVRQFQFGEWRQEAEGLPQSTPALLDLIMQVHKTKLGLGHDGPITVHCSAGTARSGIFITLSNLIERMRHESVIDLFQTVRLLRWQRPALLQTEDQYQYCYLAALEYLKMYEQLNFL